MLTLTHSNAACPHERQFYLNIIRRRLRLRIVFYNIDSVFVHHS